MLDQDVTPLEDVIAKGLLEETLVGLLQEERRAPLAQQRPDLAGHGGPVHAERLLGRLPWI